MVMPEAEVEAEAEAKGAAAGPRISFSAEFLGEDSEDCISISPGGGKVEKEMLKGNKGGEFEFLSGSEQRMLSADELFFEGKLLPFWQMQQPEKKLLNVNLIKTKEKENEEEDKEEDEEEEEEKRVSWFMEEDPSPRPPKCTVLWKELLRLKKQRASTSTLSPSSSSSSTSSSSSSLGDAARKEERKEEANSKRIKKSASMRIRPMINVPICTTNPKSIALPPLFPLKNGRPDRRR